MKKYITQHRRGTSEQWKTASDTVILDGEIVIEQSSDGYTRLKVGNGVSTYAELPYMNIPGSAIITKKTSIELPVSQWVGDATPYSQVVDISDITNNSKVDLQLSVEQLSLLQNEKISLITVNSSGTITIYAVGGKPSADFTADGELGSIQATITEMIGG